MSDEASIVEFSEDVSNQEAPPPLPKGEYPFQIRSAVQKTSANSGNKYAEVGCYISPDDFPADFPTDQAPDGVVLYYRRVTLEDNPSARYRLRKFVEAIGAPPVSTRLDLNEWVGLSAIAVIDHSEFEGETRAEIKAVKPE